MSLTKAKAIDEVGEIKRNGHADAAITSSNDGSQKGFSKRGFKKGFQSGKISTRPTSH